MPSGREEVHRQVRRLFGSGTVAGMTDGELLSRFVNQHDELAFSVLVERHGPMVLRVCRGVLRGHHDAEDAFQATFLVLARRACSLRVRDSLSPWLFGVARRVARRARADAARRARHERNVAEWCPVVVSHERDRFDVQADLWREVERLPEAYRSPVVLCYLRGMSYEAAARHLGVSEGTIRGRLARARDRLRVRLGRRGVGLPAGLLVAGSSGKSASAIVPSRLVNSTVRLGMRSISGKPTAVGTISASVATLTEGILRTMLVTRLKTAAMVILVATCALVTTGIPLLPPRIGVADAADPTLSAAARPKPRGAVATSASQDQAGPDPRAETPVSRDSGREEPALVRETTPKPWETTVRIKVHQDRAIGFGSGTIIRSATEESLVLTCAHTFKLDGGRVLPPREFPYPITVDLFDGRIAALGKAQVHYSGSVRAEVVDYDQDRDVGLLRIRPGRKLPASPIVPPSWRPVVGMTMTTAGCSEGDDATFWTTRITKPSIRGLSGNPSYQAIECAVAPKQGRNGGGLFTADGSLAGVCNFADPRGNRGLYAPPESIDRLLERNGLHALRDRTTVPKSETTTSPPDDRSPSQVTTEDEGDFKGHSMYEGEFHPESYDFNELLERWLGGDLPELHSGGFSRSWSDAGCCRLDQIHRVLGLDVVTCFRVGTVSPNEASPEALILVEFAQPLGLGHPRGRSR